MCGFCGYLNLDGAPATSASLPEMCDRLYHRGPDDDGQFVTGPVALGNRRLAVLDLGCHAALPMTRGPITLAYNGEVYDFVVERTRLEQAGYRFTSQGDTETVLALYREHGDAFVDRLDGMFAFALWDDERQRLLLGRDPAGKKPLFLCRTGRRLVFGSEIKSLLAHPDVPREPAAELLPLILAYGYAPTPHTAFRGIESLPPGELWEAADGQLRKLRTFGPTLRATSGDGAYEDWAPQVIATLRESVRQRLVSDVPLGAFLSGGVDSSLVVAMMAETASGPVRTFSIGFAGEGRFDESAYAQRVAEQYGTEHTEFHPQVGHLPELLPRILWHAEQPFADSSAVPALILSELTREHVTVALCGDGGDELFAGYENFKIARDADRGPLGWPGVRPALRSVGRLLCDCGRDPFDRRPAARAARLARQLAVGMPGAYLFSKRTADRVLAMLCPPPWDPDPRTYYDSAFAAADDRDWVSRTLDFNYRTYLLDDLLPKMDRMSMATALEVRSPFLSNAMVRLASEVPTGLKLRGDTPKWLLRQIARQYVPAEIIDRPKQGFALPLARWFREPGLRDWLGDLLLGPAAAARGGYSRRGLEQVLAEHQAGTRDHETLLWTLCTVELWYRQFIVPPRLSAPVGVLQPVAAA